MQLGYTEHYATDEERIKALQEADSDSESEPSHTYTLDL